MPAKWPSDARPSPWRSPPKHRIKHHDGAGVTGNHAERLIRPAIRQRRGARRHLQHRRHRRAADGRLRLLASYCRQVTMRREFRRSLRQRRRLRQARHAMASSARLPPRPPPHFSYRQAPRASIDTARRRRIAGIIGRYRAAIAGDIARFSAGGRPSRRGRGSATPRSPVMTSGRVGAGVAFLDFGDGERLTIRFAARHEESRQRRRGSAEWPTSLLEHARRISDQMPPYHAQRRL